MTVSKSIQNLGVFLAGDYSGIEVRMLCEASEDPLLTKQFNNTEIDIHSLVGHELTGWPAERIRDDKETRTAVKEFHFGVIYGLGLKNGPLHLQAKGVKITTKQFAQFHKRYFERYTGVKRFIDRCHKMVEEQHAITTIFGFRRKIPRTDDSRGSYYLNQAVNTPIQGAAHQLVLIAMALLRLKPKTYCLLAHTVIMEVHDELVFIVRLGDLVEADLQLRHLLEVGVPQYCASHFKRTLRVPLVAETEAGFTRGSMVNYKAPIGDLNNFLPAWRKKQHQVMAKPLQELIPEVTFEEEA